MLGTSVAFTILSGRAYSGSGAPATKKQLLFSLPFLFYFLKKRTKNVFVDLGNCWLPLGSEKGKARRLEVELFNQLGRVDEPITSIRFLYIISDFTL